MTIYIAGPESIHSPALVVSKYTLTMSKTGNGTIVPAAGEHTYIEGKKVMLVAAPDEGNVFIGWEGSTVEDSESSPTQITMNGNKTVNAVFQAQVTLTLVSTGGGTTIPAPTVIVYPLNEKVTLKAAANEGYEFKGWSGDITDTSDTYELTMDADKTVAATFAEAEVAATNNKKLYLATGKMKAFWMVDGIWRFFATSVHKYLDDLLSDDHPQYLNENRHDVVDRHELGTVVPHDTAEGVGALTKLSGSALPTAGEEYRGQFFMLEGSGDPATDDTIYCCISVDGGTTFTWKPLS